MENRSSIKSAFPQYPKVIEPFNQCSWISSINGYIVWRTGTGLNIELLHIRSYLKGIGIGRRLVYDMLRSLKSSPPYHSVFGFTRSSNTEAQRFYGALGFNLQPFMGLYKEGTAVLFWQSYEALVELMNRYTNENSLHSKAQPTTVKRR